MLPTPQQGGDFFPNLLLLLFFVQRFESYDGFGVGLSTGYTLCFLFAGGSKDLPKLCTLAP
jgi:hypothetical protein